MAVWSTWPATPSSPIRERDRGGPLRGHGSARTRGAQRECLDDPRLDFRIGIHLGDVIVDGDDILGDGINVAARLQALADAGGICISRTVFNQVRNKIEGISLSS